MVMIDNYDSFTYNLVQLFYEFDLEVLVFRHDAITLAEIEALRPDWICISPGDHLRVRLDRVNPREDQIKVSLA